LLPFRSPAFGRHPEERSDEGPLFCRIPNQRSSSASKQTITPIRPAVILPALMQEGSAAKNLFSVEVSAQASPRRAQAFPPEKIRAAFAAALCSI